MKAEIGLKDELEYIAMAYVSATYPEALKIREHIRGKIAYYSKLAEEADGKEKRRVLERLRAWKKLYSRLRKPIMKEKKVMRWF